MIRMMPELELVSSLLVTDVGAFSYPNSYSQAHEREGNHVRDSESTETFCAGVGLKEGVRMDIRTKSIA